MWETENLFISKLLSYTWLVHFISKGSNCNNNNMKHLFGIREQNSRWFCGTKTVKFVTVSTKNQYIERKHKNSGNFCIRRQFSIKHKLTCHSIQPQSHGLHLLGLIISVSQLCKLICRALQYMLTAGKRGCKQTELFRRVTKYHSWFPGKTKSPQLMG